MEFAVLHHVDKNRLFLQSTFLSGYNTTIYKISKTVLNEDAKAYKLYIYKKKYWKKKTFNDY